MRFGVSTPPLEHCSTERDALPMRGTFVSWTQTTAVQCRTGFLSVLLHTLLSKDYLWSMHHPSTCNRLMEPLTISPTVKKEKSARKRKREKCKPFISQTAPKLCFVLPLSAIIPVCMSQTVGVGEACGRGGTRGRGLLKNPFTQPGVVTWIQWDRGEGHSTLK